MISAATTSATIPDYITAAYTEVCASYHALDEARMKRLGLLPVASIVGLLAVGSSASASAPFGMQWEVVGYIGVFSALFTLALFGYEIRGILMCYDLYVTGAGLERLMSVQGQFRTCDETRQLACYGRRRFGRALARSINGRVTPCAVYSLIFAAWFFVGLRFAFGVHLHKCVWWAAGAGIALTVLTSLLLRYLIDATEPGEVAGAEGLEAPSA